jgi:hypothetical protein
LHGCMMLCRRIVGYARRAWETIEWAPEFRSRTPLGSILMKW